MGEKKKSYRDRYFEDWQAVKVPAQNRKGYRVEYRYTGLWKQWEDPDGRPLKNSKWQLALLEILSIAVYVLAVLSRTPLSVARLANGFGTLSLVPWIAELAGVVRFLAAGAYVRELTASEISTSIRSGSVLRAILAALSAAAGGIQILAGHTAVPADLLTFLGILASAGLSLAVKHQYDRLQQNTFRNDNGKPGVRY